MDMYEAIKNFSQQFSYQPEIQNKEKLSSYNWYVVAGMGGSHLAADILKMYNPSLPITIHENYGLPWPAEMLKGSLVIVSSYSGNTEEVIDTYQKAKEGGLALAVVSVGGKLIEMAQEDGVPYIQLPNTGIQPRSALGFSLKALMALTGQDDALSQIDSLSDMIPGDLEEEGKKLAKDINNMVPVIYSSQANYSIAYNWKIKFNETGKIPAFCNAFPELNHNEMTGFDFNEKTKKMSENFCFIMLRDNSDHPKVIKRMDITSTLLQDRGLRVITVELEGKDVLHKIFSSLLLADFAAYYTAEANGAESEKVPMVEEFKKLILE